MVLKITRLLMMLVLFTDIHINNTFDYGIAHKNNLSDNTIQLIIYIQNKNMEDINSGTVYDISINEYEGKFTVAKTIQKNCTGKGIIYIYGDLSEDRFKNIYDSNTEQLNFSMKESNNKDGELPA